MFLLVWFGRVCLVWFGLVCFLFFVLFVLFFVEFRIDCHYFICLFVCFCLFFVQVLVWIGFFTNAHSPPLPSECPPTNPDPPLLPSTAFQEAEEFSEYARDLSEYLLTLEQRLFSEGLHTLGHPPDAAETEQYLAAYYGDDLPAEVQCNTSRVKLLMP